METKDLILLLLIPVLAISLIVYTYKSPSIIGAVTAEQEQNNVLGTYSLNPSFKAKIDYSMDDYANIKQTLDKIIEDCKNREDIGQCLRDKSIELNWNCETQKSNNEASAILHDFVDKFNECLKLEGNNIVCRFSFDERKLENSPLYNIELSSEGGKINAKLKLTSEILATTYIGQGNIFYVDNYDTKKRKQADLVNIMIKYVGKRPNIYNAYAESSEDKSKINLIDEQKSFESRNFLFLYKNTDEFGYSQVSFIDSQVQDSFRAPPPANNIVDLPKTKGIKFCAKTGKQVYAYDAADNQVKLRDIVYKFAVTFPSLPPEPVKNVEVFDKPKAEKSVLLKWENSSNQNVVKYRTYYTEIPDILSKTSTDDLRKNTRVSTRDIILDENPSVDFEGTLNIQECAYKNRKCMFSTSEGAKTAIDNGKLYYFKNGNYYVYTIVLPNDNVNYDFAVTALDKNNNEINNINEKQKMLVKTIKSTDDMPPDSSNIIQGIQYESSQKQVAFTILKTPDKNLDLSQLNDLKEYKTYYVKKQALSPQQTGEVMNSISDSRLNQLVLIGNVGLQNNQFQIDISSTSPQSGENYFFIVAAFDNIGNPKEEQFKINELGASPLQTVIP